MVASFPYRIIHLFNHRSSNCFFRKHSVSLSKPILFVSKVSHLQAKHSMHVPYCCILTISWMPIRCILADDSHEPTQTATLNEHIVTRQARAPSESVSFAVTRCLVQWTRSKGIPMVCNYSFIMTWRRVRYRQVICFSVPPLFQKMRVFPVGSGMLG